MKVVILNGPPRSGKDTLKSVLLREFPDAVASAMATPLHEFWSYVFYSVSTTYEEYKEYTDGSKKNEPHPALGFSYRSAMIDMSEEYIKNRYGSDFFGKVSAKSIANSGKRDTFFSFDANLLIVSDSGFIEETVPLITEFGAENILHIKLYRAGTNYDQDSRSYLDLEAFGVKSRDLINDDLDTASAHIIDMVRDFISEKSTEGLDGAD